MTDPAVIETLYYMLDIAVLKGNLEKAETYLASLRKKAKECPESFAILKEGDRLKHLNKLQTIVDQKLVVKSFNFQDADFKEGVKSDGYAMDYEKNLQKEIFSNPDVLRKCLGASEAFHIGSMYVPVGYGIIDMIADEGKTRYVIELKKDIARHDIIEQLHKYMLYYKIRYNFKLWDKVVGVAIANGFQEYPLKELTKADILCVKYSYKNNKLKMDIA